MTRNEASQKLFLYSTAVSDVGYVRSNNQDSAFAGERLVAMCDGMGGHAGGDTASTIAIRSLAHIERDDRKQDVQSLARMMETSVIAAHDAIVGKAKREHRLSGMGTTVTALALADDSWVLAHIGDSRGYLLREGKLIRMTQDHSYVQHLIDTGRISPAEARNHPQRNVVMRVLGDFDIDPRPDISISKALPADRWMICSDGLCGVLEDSTIAEVLSSVSDQAECAQQLVTFALKAGSTDNVTVVIADATLALDADAFDLPHQTPLVGGAASSNLEALADILDEPVAAAPHLRDESRESPAKRAADLAQDRDAAKQEGEEDDGRTAQPSAAREESGERHVPDTSEIPVVHKKDGSDSADPYDPDVANAIHKEHLEQRKRQRSRHRQIRLILAGIITLVILALAGGTAAAYRWSQEQYYLGADQGRVVIYQGVPTKAFALSLSHPVQTTDISVKGLPQSWRDQLEEGITVSSMDDAQEHARLIRKEAGDLKRERAKEGKDESDQTAASPSTSPSPSKTDQSRRQ